MDFLLSLRSAYLRLMATNITRNSIALCSYWILVFWITLCIYILFCSSALNMGAFYSHVRDLNYAYSSFIFRIKGVFNKTEKICCCSKSRYTCRIFFLTKIRRIYNFILLFQFLWWSCFIIVIFFLTCIYFNLIAIWVFITTLKLPNF